MNQPVFKKSVSVILITIMLLAIFAAPIGLDKVYADELQANASNNRIIVPDQIIAGKSFLVKAIGDRQKAINFPDSVDGETAYIPNFVQLSGSNNEFEFLDPISFYEVSLVADYVGKTVVTARFDHMTYTAFGTRWSDLYGAADDKEIVINVLGTVKFNPNGGTTKTTRKYRSNGAIYGTLPVPKRSGFIFKGWYTGKTGGTKIAASTRARFGYNSSITLYAHWLGKTTVKFNANKGKVAKKSKTIMYGSKYGALPTPKRSGYKFSGWYTKKSGGSKITKNTKVNRRATHTLYAHWIGPKGKGRTITKAEYNRIKKGMTYSEAKFLIGGSGELLSVYSTAKVYSWKGRGSLGANAVITFSNNKVYSKAQSGLR